MDFMKFMNPYFSVKQRIETLERWILVHSYLYYELDKSIVDDRKFDKNALQLVELIKQMDTKLKQAVTIMYLRILMVQQDLTCLKGLMGYTKG
jgi:hypothetical protein